MKIRLMLGSPKPKMATRSSSYFLAGGNLAIQNTPLGRKALTPLVHQTAHFKPRHIMMLMSDPNFTIRQITFDCHDPSKLAEFWSAATGCESATELTTHEVPGLVWTVMQDPEGNEFCVGNPGA